MQPKVRELGRLAVVDDSEDSTHGQLLFGGRCFGASRFAAPNVVPNAAQRQPLSSTGAQAGKKVRGGGTAVASAPEIADRVSRWAASSALGPGPWDGCAVCLAQAQPNRPTSNFLNPTWGIPLCVRYPVDRR